MEWRREKLGSVCEIIKRGVAPKYIEEGGICVINQKCIRDHVINYTLARRHNLEIKKVIEERYIQVGDVLVNSTGTGTLGRVAQVRDVPIEPTTVDTHVTIVRPKRDLFHSDFFGYMLIKIEEEITSAGEGASGQTELARTKLENEFFVSYPDSIPEQKRIVALLDTVFADLEQTRAKTEQNLKNARELFESYLNDLFHKNDDWPEKLVGDVCDLFQGLAINKKTKYLLVEKSSLPLLRIKDLRNNSEEQYVAEEGYPEKARVYKDDVIYTRTGNSLGLVFTGRSGILHNNSFKVMPNELIQKSYLYWWLQHSIFKDQIFKLASKAAQPDISHKIFKIQKIKVPPKSFQLEAVKSIEKLKYQAKTLEEVYETKLAAIDELKKSILQKAFNGELTETTKQATAT